MWLVADTGDVALGGTVEAKNADGSGGIVDTDASRFAFGADGSRPLVRAGTWNLTAPDLKVGPLTAATFARSLNAGTSIDAETTGAAQGKAGDIVVMSSIHWTGAASLTLGAYRSLTIEAGAKLENCGAGNLALDADASALDNGGSVTNRGIVDWSNSTGIVSALYDMNGSYTPGTLAQSFATGPVNNPNGIPPAGIVSINGGTIGNDVYWNKDTTGATLGVYSGTPVPAANGLTNAQMQQTASFVGYLEFSASSDFERARASILPISKKSPEPLDSNKMIFK